MTDLDVAEADAFSNAIGPDLWPKITLFPLHGIDPEGRCACRDPHCNQPGKHPAIKWGEENHPNGTQILQRDDGVGVGVGLATGQRSGGIVVIDVDTKGGVPGPASLSRLQNELGRLPETLRVDSPSGGWHLYFRHPGRFQNNAGVIGAGIDIRAEGGYVVIPGSPHKAGGVYRLEIDAPIALLPAPWADRLPRAGTTRRPIVRDVLATVEPHTLRQRLSDTAKGRKGDTWASWRLVALGERALRLQGGPDGPAPLVHGVDEYLNKQLIWPLALVDTWADVAGADIAALIAPSLATLRDDAEALGTPSKWTPEHFADRWDYAANKIAAERSALEAAAARWREQIAETKATIAADLPSAIPAVQINRAYYLLDDREPSALRYVGPLDGTVVLAMARKLWGQRRVLEYETTKGDIRDMSVPELVHTHGTPAERIAIEYAAAAPYVQDLTLVQTLRADVPRPEPRYDPEVAHWLHLLDPSDAIVAWLAHASPERCADTAPALTLICESGVGKTVLAAAVARAAGMETYSPLARSLGKFAGDVLGDGPIIFGDEGIPKDERSGVPKTEEFRDLVTRAIHKLEKKGQSMPVLVRGGVRVILAANRMDRLFANRGSYSGADVAAIVRRLLVVELLDAEHGAAASAAVDALGTSPLDPVRLERVAGHVRHLQTLDVPAPRASAGKVAKALRAGGDLASAALALLEDRTADASTWVAVDEQAGLLWVQSATFARALQTPAGPLGRALAAYTRDTSKKMRTHPTTGAALDTRERWTSLDLAQLRADGCEIPLTTP